MLFSKTSYLKNLWAFLGCAMLLPLMLASGAAHAQADYRLRLLNQAVHDTTFLKKAPAIQYPLVFVYKQERFYQKSADAPVEKISGGLSDQQQTLVKVQHLELVEQKQQAKLKMRWNNTIIKLNLQNYQLAESQARLRSLKIRTKNKFWPSYLYFDNSGETEI